ncbi:MAG TPA: hypothetical protein VH595_04765, partial [Verrucomicrobiae bacterium]|nr:hypothetical protein [Verrucomicrobiae bacterium]
DGQLDSTTPATGTITGSGDDVYLGGAPDYTATSNERFFAGSICQAAFFTNVITPSEIQELYTTATGASTQITLSIGKSGGNVVLTWNTGTLLSSTNLAGPFTTNAVSGAVSPYIVAPSGAATFFEIRGL